MTRDSAGGPDREQVASPPLADGDPEVTMFRFLESTLLLSEIPGGGGRPIPPTEASLELPRWGGSHVGTASPS